VRLGRVCPSRRPRRSTLPVPAGGRAVRLDRPEPEPRPIRGGRESAPSTRLRSRSRTARAAWQRRPAGLLPGPVTADPAPLASRPGPCPRSSRRVRRDVACRRAASVRGEEMLLSLAPGPCFHDDQRRQHDQGDGQTQRRNGVDPAERQNAKRRGRGQRRQPHRCGRWRSRRAMRLAENRIVVAQADAEKGAEQVKEIQWLTQPAQDAERNRGGPCRHGEDAHALRRTVERQYENSQQTQAGQAQAMRLMAVTSEDVIQRLEPVQRKYLKFIRGHRTRYAERGDGEPRRLFAYADGVAKRSRKVWF